MGKYMRKAKLTSGEVAVVDLPHHPPLGVRTRARTLALQRRHPSPSPSTDCYLHLRSRRLEKPIPTEESIKRETGADLDELSSKGRSFERKSENEGLGLEGSCGDNVAEVDAAERNVREATPCSLIRDPGTVTTPTSTSKTFGRKREVDTCRDVPSSDEIEEFFANAEQLQHRLFLEKYNFDPLNDCPRPGRFDWVKLKSC